MFRIAPKVSVLPSKSRSGIDIIFVLNACQVIAQWAMIFNDLDITKRQRKKKITRKTPQWTATISSLMLYIV